MSAAWHHAREFLAKVLPWPEGYGAGKLSGAAPYYNLHWRAVSAQTQKSYWAGRTNSSLDEFMSQLAFFGRAQDSDMYVCMSSQAKTEHKISKAGRLYFNAMRHKNDALELQSIYIDIDVKEDAYKDTPSAIEAFKEFLTKTGLPEPTAVVGTGSGGMHCHWALEAPLSVRDWEPLSRAMVRACHSEGLIIDGGCTVDAARLLRIPGSFNHKHNPPRPVELWALGERYNVEDIKKFLEPYNNVMDPQVGVNLPVLSTPKRVTLVGNAELSGGIEITSAPRNPDAVAVNCEFIREALSTGGANFSNPLWFASANVASYCEAPRETTHRFSSGHPTYSPADTDDLYERVLRTRSGWVSCEKIESLGYAGCKTCPLRVLNKSPLNHDKDPNANPEEIIQGERLTILTEDGEEVPVVEVPHGYIVSADGIVSRRGYDDNMQPISLPVFAYPMLAAWLQDNPWVLHFSTFVASGRRAKIECPLDELGSKDGMVKVFARQGMLMPDKQSQELREFLVSWIKMLQESKDAVVSSTPFGWTVAHGKIEGFTYAGKVWSAEGHRPASAPDGVLGSQYNPRGSLDPWIAAAKIITDQSRPALDAILAASFGAPLVRFTGHSGVLMSAYSPESGIGKSTTMKVAQAVWGDPIKAMQTLNDTPNSVLNKIGQIKALPLFWDELKTEADTQKFAILAFQLTQGVEKSRMNSDVTQRERGTWETMLVSASNDSLIDPINKATKSTTAGILRLFEYVVPPGVHGQIEHGKVSRAVARLNDNFGSPGLLYAQFLGAHYERIAKEIEQIQDALSHKLKVDNEERLWVATITVVLAGAKYANELGLTSINIRALKDFMLEILQNMRGELVQAPNDMKNTDSVLTILAQFFNDMRARHTIITNKIHRGRGKPAKGAYAIKSAADKLESLYVHIGIEDGLVRFSSTFFSKWLTENDYSRHAIVKALKESFGATYVNGKLGSGTSYSAPMEYLLEMDLGHDGLKEFMDVG